MKMVEFVKGFKLPTAAEKKKALGIKQTDGTLDISSKVWKPISRPTHIDDWLAQYVEEGQTFAEWKALFSKRKLKHKNKNNTKYIYLVALNSEQTADQVLRNQKKPEMSELIKFVESFFYPYQVKLLPDVSLSEPTSGKKSRKKTLLAKYYPGKSKDECWDWDVAYRIAHKYNLKKTSIHERQLFVSDLIDILSYLLPNDAFCLCGVTMEDLYEGATDSFVSGMAAGGSHVGIFSFSRYRLNNFDDLSISEQSAFQITQLSGKKRKRTLTDKQLFETAFLRRCCKTLVHEIAHLFVIDHCIYFDCCMNGSGHLLEDFQQTIHLCPIDLRKISCIIGEDNFLERYQRLHSFFEEHQIVGDAMWIKEQIELVKIKKSQQ